MSRIPAKQIILDTDVTLSNDSDILISSQKAVKAYVDTAIGAVGVSFKTTIVGDNTTTAFNIEHSLTTDDTIVNVYEINGNKENIGVTIARPDTDNITITFAVAPPVTESYRVMILKV